MNNEETRLDMLERAKERQQDDSIIVYLTQRSLGQHNVTCHRQLARRQYLNICPDTTLYEQELPDCLKRFSLSGRLLIGFGRSSHSVVIHDVVYRNQPLSASLCASSFFPVRHEIMLCFGVENLCRDFCLFTPDDRYVILASADSSSNATEYSSHAQSNANPHTLTGLSSLDEVRFHIVDMERGKATDKLEFTHDYILLSNHAGVGMNGRRLGILSLENQLIKIFEISDTGKFVECGIVGYKLDMEDQECPPVASGGTRPLLGLKQRLFGHLYQRAQAQAKPFIATRILYNNWDIIENLCISRFQFLDQDHLLLKLVCPEALSLRTRGVTDSGLQNTAFFAVYSLKTTKILSFHRSTSLELYEAFRDYNDYVRVVSSVDTSVDEGLGISWQTTPATDLYERQLWDRNFQLLAASRPHQGEVYAAKRLLMSLPYSQQSYSESPYVDSAIFRFDERSVSASERQRSASEFPVKFFSRRSNRVIFRLNSGTNPDAPSTSMNPYRVKKYTQWIFHPYLPLVISSQHTLIRSTTVNIHYRAAPAPDHQ